MTKKPSQTATDEAPFLSCIVTAYNEGPLANLALQSILAQSFTDFEILVVDDGASGETRDVIRSYDDPRIVHIRQANDGPSSARNRALNVARGDYVCFLDADDTRPVWAFESMIVAAGEGVDVVFSPGTLCELRQEVLPFYDQPHFASLQAEGLTELYATGKPEKWQRALRLLTCVEPQGANKMVRREFINKHKLRYPNGLSFFEDSNFHLGVLMNMESFAVSTLPTFTYFRRYGQPRLTESQSLLRFDALASVANALHLFSKSQYFHDTLMRKLLLAYCFRVIQWGEESLSLDLRYSYRQAVRSLALQIDQRYMKPLSDENRAKAYEYAPWVQPSLEYVFQVK